MRIEPTGAHFAAQGVIAGAYDCVIAAGVELMSRVPMGASARPPAIPFGPKMTERYREEKLYGTTGLFPQGISAEIISKKWNLSREALDEFSVGSHKKAAMATEKGWFSNEIVPVEITHDDGRTETMATRRRDSPRHHRRQARHAAPAFDEKGVITAGNSSQITDGAAAILIMERKRAEQLGLKPRARFHAFALGTCDPVIMLTAPIPGDAQRAQALRHDARSDGRGRDQRGVRAGGARLGRSSAPT